MKIPESNGAPYPRILLILIIFCIFSLSLPQRQPERWKVVATQPHVSKEWLNCWYIGLAMSNREGDCASMLHF